MPPKSERYPPSLSSIDLLFLFRHILRAQKFIPGKQIYSLLPIFHNIAISFYVFVFSLAHNILIKLYFAAEKLLLYQNGIIEPKHGLFRFSVAVYFEIAFSPLSHTVS